MKFKKLLIPSLFSLCLFSLTSCDLAGFIKDNAGIDIDNIIPSAPEEETYEPVVIDTDNMDYGYLDLQKYDSKKEYLIGLYTDINNALSEFMTSNRTLELEAKEVGGELKNYYIIKDKINFSKYALSYTEASAVYKAVLLDHPEYYFVSNTLLNSTETVGVFEDGQLVQKTNKYLCLVCDNDYYKASDRLNYNQQLADYDTNIKTMISSITNPLQQVKTIHDYIITHAQYSFKTDGVTPDDSSFAHNLLGIVVNQKGVCESYAELFHYLLKNNGIESIMVVGNAYSSPDASPEGHAWNYVKFYKEEFGVVEENWYGFDVTWDDPVPDSSVITINSHKYFGKVDTSFTDSHVADPDGDLSSGIAYLYALPELADVNISIADLL